VRQMLLYLPSLQGARQEVGLQKVTLQRAHGCDVVLHYHRRSNTRSILHTLRKLQRGLPHEDKHTRNHKTDQTRSHKTTQPQQTQQNLRHHDPQSTPTSIDVYPPQPNPNHPPPTHFSFKAFIWSWC